MDTEPLGDLADHISSLEVAVLDLAHAVQEAATRQEEIAHYFEAIAGDVLAHVEEASKELRSQDDGPTGCALMDAMAAVWGTMT